MRIIALIITLALCSLARAGSTNVCFYEPTNGITLFTKSLPIDIFNKCVFWDVGGANPNAFSPWTLPNGAGTYSPIFRQSVASNTPTYLSSGALSFDGNDYIIGTSSNEILLGTNDFTFAIWVYTLSTNANRMIFDSRSASLNGCNFGLLAGGFLNASFTRNANVKSVSGTSSLTTGQWYHVAFTVNRAGNMAVWLNGATNGTASASGVGSITASGSAVLGYKSYSGSSFSYYIGYLYDGLFALSEFSTNEIQALYAKGPPQ